MRPTEDRHYGRSDHDDTSEIPRVAPPRHRREPEPRTPSYGYVAQPYPPQAVAAGSKTQVWLLAALSFVLFLTLVLGAFYTLTVINDRNGQIADLEDDVVTLTGEKQALSGQIATLTTERDDARTTITDLEGDVGELERQLSQARGDASREQGRANTAEAVGGVLAEVIMVDDQIHQQFAILVTAVDSMYTNAVNRYYSAAARDMDTVSAAFVELDRLFVQRDTLMGQFQ